MFRANQLENSVSALTRVPAPRRAMQVAAKVENERKKLNGFARVLRNIAENCSVTGSAAADQPTQPAVLRYKVKQSALALIRDA